MKKTKNLMVGIVASMTAVGMSGCTSEALPPQPTGTDCADWDWNSDLGAYECDDDTSTVYRSYYHGGRTFSSPVLLKNDSSYKSYKSSSSFKGSSGFGSGSKSFGG